jgi:hypothetical protein
MSRKSSFWGDLFTRVMEVEKAKEIKVEIPIALLRFVTTMYLNDNSINFDTTKQLNELVEPEDDGERLVEIVDDHFGWNNEVGVVQIQHVVLGNQDSEVNRPSQHPEPTQDRTQQSFTNINIEPAPDIAATIIQNWNRYNDSEAIRYYSKNRLLFDKYQSRLQIVFR